MEVATVSHLLSTIVATLGNVTFGSGTKDEEPKEYTLYLEKEGQVDSM